MVGTAGTQVTPSRRMRARVSAAWKRPPGVTGRTTVASAYRGARAAMRQPKECVRGRAPSTTSSRPRRSVWWTRPAVWATREAWEMTADLGSPVVPEV